MFFCLVLLSVCVLSCTPAVPVSPADTLIPTPVPIDNVERYRFELGNISIMPAEAPFGTPVQVIVPVKNIGSAKNAYIATLYIDGQEYLTEDITLDPGTNGALLYMVSNLSAGKHNLTLADFSGTVQIYYSEKYTITNNRIFLPHYSRLEDTPEPPLPHSSVDSFTAPVTPFFITKISFRYPYPQSFQILDSSNNLLYSADIAYNESAYLPGIRVDEDFTVQMQTGQPVADIRAEWFSRNSWFFQIAYFWPEVSTVEGIAKRFGP